MDSCGGAGTRLSPALPVNWGQVISVTAENVPSADEVVLTFLERKSTNIQKKKATGREEGGGCLRGSGEWGGREIKLALRSSC